MFVVVASSQQSPPPRLGTNVLPFKEKLQNKQLLEKLHEGVTWETFFNGWLHVNQQLKVELDASAAHPVVEISQRGEPLAKYTDRFYVYDGHQDFVNEVNHSDAETSPFQTHLFQANPYQLKVREVSPASNMVTMQDIEWGDGLLALKGVFYGRHMRREAVDAQPKKNSRWKDSESLSIQIVPLSALMKKMDQVEARDKALLIDVEGPQELLSQELLYQADLPSQRKRDVVLGAFAQFKKSKKYGGARISGPFLMPDPWSLWLDGQCEFYDCAQVGAQSIAYMDADDPENLFGLASWEKLKASSKDDVFVVGVHAVGPDDFKNDFLVAVFAVYRSTIESQQRIFYRQKNTKGGIDFMMELQLVAKE
jgi:hypothetical protein